MCIYIHVCISFIMSVQVFGSNLAPITRTGIELERIASMVSSRNYILLHIYFCVYVKVLVRNQ